MSFPSRPSVSSLLSSTTRAARVWGASDEDAADGYALLVTMMEYAREARAAGATRSEVLAAVERGSEDAVATVDEML